MMSTRSRPSTVMIAHAPSAHAHHGACTVQVGGGVGWRRPGRARRTGRPAGRSRTAARPARRPPRRAAQAAGDQRVKRSRVGDVAGHRHVPGENSAKITATTTNAAGMPVRPVVAYAVGMTPAATVSGATPARTNDSTAGMPSRSRASADGHPRPAGQLAECGT